MSVDNGSIVVQEIIRGGVASALEVLRRGKVLQGDCILVLMDVLKDAKRKFINDHSVFSMHVPREDH